MRRVLVGTFVAFFLLAIVTPLVAQQGTSEIAGRTHRRTGRGASRRGTSSSPTKRPCVPRRSSADRKAHTFRLTACARTLPALGEADRISCRLNARASQLQVGNTLTINSSLAVGRHRRNRS